MSLQSKLFVAPGKAFAFNPATPALIAVFAGIVGVFVYQYGLLAMLGAVLFLFLLAWMFGRPEATTLIILFVIYSNLAVVAVHYHGAPEIVSVGFFLLLGLPLVHRLVVQRKKAVFNPVFFLMLGYLVIMLAAGIFSQDAGRSLVRVIGYLCEGVILYFLIVNAIQTQAMLRKAIWAVLAAGILMGSITLYQSLTDSYDRSFGGLAQLSNTVINTGEGGGGGEEEGQFRLAGPIGEQNRYAQIMLVLLPLAVSCALNERRRALRILALLSCIPILAGVLLTFSRGAFLSVLLMLAFMIYLQRLKLRYVFLALFSAVSFVFVAMPEYVYRIATVSRMSSLASGQFRTVDSSVRGRATENLAALNIFLDHPLLGVGPGQTSQYMEEYGNKLGIKRLESTRRAHNMYLEESADNGIFGFICFMAIVLVTMRQLAAVRRYWLPRRPDLASIAAGFLLAIIGYLTSGLFLHLSYQRYYWLLLALAGAAVHVLQPEKSAKPKPSE